MHSPHKGEQVFIAPNATVIGQVHLGDFSSIWYGAVVRGDTDLLDIGAGTNIQDNAVVHTDAGIICRIGKNVTVGHSAIIHGATIGDNTLIGMRATIMNNAQIGKNCIIGAHALVTEGTIIPDNSLVIGMPAKVKKTLGEDIASKLEQSATHYQNMAQKHIRGEFGKAE